MHPIEYFLTHPLPWCISDTPDDPTFPTISDGRGTRIATNTGGLGIDFIVPFMNEYGGTILHTSSSDDCKWIMNRLEKLGLALEEKHCDAILAFCIRIQDEQANAISRKDADLIAATAEIGKLRAEVHGAQLAVDELRAELMAEQIEAAELHDLFAVQQELVKRLQNRIKRLEARA